MLTYNMDVTPESVWKRTTPSEAELAQPYYCTEAGVFYAQQHFSTARTDKESYLLFYTLRGAGLIEQGESHVVLSTGQALLVALISAAMYGVFLLIQTKTHQSLFIYEHEDDGDDDDPHHGKPSAHSSAWHTAWLLIHLVAVIAVTKMNANPLETLLTSMNAPVAFTGFLVALLILSPEGLGALKAVLNNQVQRAMNLFFGSVLATISLTVPVVTLIAFLTGNELQFGLGAPEMIVMVASLLLCQISFSTGRTNVLNGAAHLALFAAYLMTIFA
jgi:Ca2+:H+ antiporter